MRRGFGVLLGVAFVVALAIVALNRFVVAAPNRVYTVAEVQAGLRQHPRAWAGRTIQVSGDIMMRVRGGCPASAPACTSPEWVYLGPEGKPAWSRPAQVQMMISQIDQQRAQRAFAALVGRGAPPPLRLPKMEQALLLSVPAGLYVSPQMRRPLPDALYNLPLVGDTLSRLFPWNTRLIISVRLTTPASCPAGGTATCPDGIVLVS